MTDELEHIKERAAERREKMWPNGWPNTAVVTNQQDAEADLDRAIAIAEEKQIVFNMMMDSRVEVSTGEAEQMRGERDAARALADRLFEALSHANPAWDIYIEVFAAYEARDWK